MLDGQWLAVTLLLRMAPFPLGPKVGKNRPKMAKNDSKQYQTTWWPLPTGLNPPSVTNDVPM